MDLGLEQLYISINPFFWALIATMLALVFSLFDCKRTIIFFTLISFLLQTAGFTIRTIVAARAPITNMYETILFAGYVALIATFIISMFNKKIFLLLVGLAVNSLSLIMINFANNMLDATITPLPPVLRSNFWLLVHVIPTIISFSILAISWLLSNIYMLQDILKLKKDIYPGPQLQNHCYQSVKIGVFFLMIGIVTGAIWADYTWGRFWSWDPKETWALIVLLVYMALIHIKHTNWISNKTFAPLVSLCFLSVIFAWFGVNYILNKGLHSYGFSSGGELFVMLFFSTQIIFALIYTLNTLKKN